MQTNPTIPKQYPTQFTRSTKHLPFQNFRRIVRVQQRPPFQINHTTTTVCQQCKQDAKKKIQVVNNVWSKQNDLSTHVCSPHTHVLHTANLPLPPLVPTIRRAIFCKSCLSGNNAPANRAVFKTRKNVCGAVWWAAVLRSSRRLVIDAKDEEEAALEEAAALGEGGENCGM